MISLNDIFMKIRDDLYLTTKLKLMRELPENNNALYIGKFRIPTKAHIKLIEDSLKKFNKVVICIVKAKKDKKESLSFELQKEIFKSLFGDRVEIITHSSGNLISIINKSPIMIKYVICGKDREKSYEKQLEKLQNVKLIVYPRTDDISATNLIKYLKECDLQNAKKLMDKRVYNKFIDKILKELNIECNN
jgi:phosphopantetheine adenylyltransferase